MLVSALSQYQAVFLVSPVCGCPVMCTSRVAPLPQARCICRSKAALAEKQRIKATGGWVSSDGRVCDVLAVSRAFGDAEFKGEGLKRLLADGVNARFWTQDFADAAHFTSDPVIATPAVTYTAVSEELGDEFIVMASDGLWYAPHLLY